MKLEFKKLTVSADFNFEEHTNNISIKMREIFSPLDCIHNKLVPISIQKTLPYYAGEGSWYLAPEEPNRVCQTLKKYLWYFKSNIEISQDLALSRYLSLNLLIKIEEILQKTCHIFWEELFLNRILNEEILIRFKHRFFRLKSVDLTPNYYLFNQICNNDI